LAGTVLRSDAARARHLADRGGPCGGFAPFSFAATLPGVLPGDTSTMPETRNLRDVLSAMADGLIERVEADACAISRVIGDVLILVAERVPDGTTLLRGQGYLVPDYPQTAEVLETRRPRTLTLADPDLDPAEASVLRMHGFGSLVMAPFLLQGEVWGLVEAYRNDVQPFTEADVRTVVEISTVD
jgi:transcriptional regulator with GAF, ATPase, and Fis domain